MAVLLSGLLPGLGQAWLGSGRRAIALALPFIAVLAVAVMFVIIDPGRAVGAIVAPAAEVAVLTLVAALAVVHLTAVLDAMRLGRLLDRRARERAALDGVPGARPRARLTPFALLVVALVWVVGLYGTIELVGERAYSAARAVFADPGTGFEIPEASFAPRPTATPAGVPTGPVTLPPSPTATPDPGPAWAADGRLNLLLVGSDAGPGRWLARMDSITVLSVDIASGRAALFSLWRYTANVPLPPESAGSFENGRFPGYLNALYVYAMGHPKEFPGGEARGFRATAGAVQELIGQRLDGAVVVNLNGFVDLVDAIGGLWIDIPYPVSDPHYALPDGSGYIELSFHTGCQKLSGEKALQYARTRHQDSDWQRMRRQQRVITALGRQLDPVGLLPKVPDLLDVAGDNLWTTIQPDEIADLALLATHVDRSNVTSYSFWPPETPQRLDTAGIEHVRDIVATIFDDPTAEPSPTPDATPKPCPKQ
jgi:LCP family protein required for cell wall assembly